MSSVIESLNSHLEVVEQDSPVIERLTSIETKLDDLQYLLEQLAEKLNELDLPYNAGYTIEE